MREENGGLGDVLTLTRLSIDLETVSNRVIGSQGGRRTSWQATANSYHTCNALAKHNINASHDTYAAP